MSDVVSILMRLRGGREAKADADAVAGSLERTGAAAEAANQRAARGAVAAERATKRHTGAVLGLATTAKYAARQYAVFAGPAAIGAVAALGIRFDATMEQNRVAMTHFLGSVGAANKELATLYQLGKDTPFEFEQLTAAAQQLLGVDMSVGQVNKTLRATGDAIAGLGGSGEDIASVVRALTQIQAKGFVQGDELLQLQEARIPALKILQEQLGLTADQMSNIGKQRIPAETAINALTKGMSERFGGSAAEQAKTFNGQVSTLKDNLNQLLGRGAQPLFDYMRAKGLPAMNKFITEFEDGTGAGGDFKREMQDVGHDVGQVLGVVKSVAFWLGRHPALLKAAAGAWITYKTVAIAQVTKTKLATALLFSPKGTAEMEAAAAGAGKRTGSRFGGAFRAASIALIGLYAWQNLKGDPKWGQYSGKKGWGELWRDVKDDVLPGQEHEQRNADRAAKQQALDQLYPGRPGRARQRGVYRKVGTLGQLPRRRGLPALAPLSGGFEISGQMIVPVNLDGQKVAEGVARVNVRQKARK